MPSNRSFKPGRDAAVVVAVYVGAVYGAPASTAFSSAVDGATEDCHDCEAADAGCLGSAAPSQAGLVKGSAVAIALVCARCCGGRLNW